MCLSVVKQIKKRTKDVLCAKNPHRIWLPFAFLVILWGQKHSDAFLTRRNAAIQAAGTGMESLPALPAKTATKTKRAYPKIRKQSQWQSQLQ